MKPTSTPSCPRCGGFMTLDGWERDGTLCCINCGYVAWPSAELQRLRDTIPPDGVRWAPRSAA